MKYFFFPSFLFILLFFLSNKDTHFVSIHPEGDPLPCVEKSFPIAFHAIKDSLGNQITLPNLEAGIANLNELFEPICISFILDTIDTIENHTYDILDKNNELESLTSIYHIPYRINLYVGTTMGSSFYEPGFGTFQGIQQNTNTYPALGVDLGPYVTTNSLAHYMGVYFGLVPTSNIAGELVDGSNCSTTGDNFCDTPADPFTGGVGDFFYRADICRFIYPTKDANNQFYNPDISNIMSYYRNCRCTFTKSQYRQMAQTYLDAPGNTW